MTPLWFCSCSAETSAASPATRGALALAQVGPLRVLQPGLPNGLITGEPAAMSPAIQHHVLGFSHLLHTSWLPGEGAFSFYVLVRDHATCGEMVQLGFISCLHGQFENVQQPDPDPDPISSSHFFLS